MSSWEALGSCPSSCVHSPAIVTFAVRLAAKCVVMLLFWAGFNLSLMAIWGAVGFTPELRIGLVGFSLLQIPAAWLGYRVAFGE